MSLRPARDPFHLSNVEGNTFAAHFAAEHGQEEEFIDHGGQDEPQGDDEAPGIAKRQQLIAELIAFHSGQVHN